MLGARMSQRVSNAEPGAPAAQIWQLLCAKPMADGRRLPAARQCQSPVQGRHQQCWGQAGAAVRTSMLALHAGRQGATQGFWGLATLPHAYPAANGRFLW